MKTIWSINLDLTSLKFYKSIRPGSKGGELTDTDIVVLRYLPNDTIWYKSHHGGDEFAEFPRQT